MMHISVEYIQVQFSAVMTAYRYDLLHLEMEGAGFDVVVQTEQQHLKIHIIVQNVSMFYEIAIVDDK